MTTAEDVARVTEQFQLRRSLQLGKACFSSVHRLNLERGERDSRAELVEAARLWAQSRASGICGYEQDEVLATAVEAHRRAEVALGEDILLRGGA